jgi:hypothetical protein
VEGVRKLKSDVTETQKTGPVTPSEGRRSNEDPSPDEAHHDNEFADHSKPLSPPKAIVSVPPIGTTSSLTGKTLQPLKEMTTAAHTLAVKPSSQQQSLATLNMPTEPVVPTIPHQQPVVSADPHKPTGSVVPGVHVPIIIPVNPVNPPDPLDLVNSKSMALSPTKAVLSVPPIDSSPIREPLRTLQEMSNPPDPLDPVNSKSMALSPTKAVLSVPPIDSSPIREPLRTLQEVSNTSPFATPIEPSSDLGDGDPIDDRTEAEGDAGPDAEGVGKEPIGPTHGANGAAPSQTPTPGKENNKATKGKKAGKAAKPATNNAKPKKGRNLKDVTTKPKRGEKDKGSETTKRKRVEDEGPDTTKRKRAKKSEPTSESAATEPEPIPGLRRGTRERIVKVRVE